MAGTISEPERYPGVAALWEGMEAMQQLGSPEDGWYMLWRDANGDLQRSYLLTESSYVRSNRERKQFAAPAACLIGIYHDDYFPPPEES